MGNFSWCTSDTEKSIPCVYDTYDGAPTTVYLLNPFGEPYKESNYEGYGEFGGRDVYELVAEWNKPYLSEANLRKPARSDYVSDKEGTECYKRALDRYNKKCVAIKEYAAGATDEYIREHYGTVFGYGDGSDWKRCLGIDIACYDEQQVRLRYPIKIVENVCDYEEAFISPSCPFQGCFYDDTLSAIQQGVIRVFDKLMQAERAYADEKADVLDNFFASQKMDDCFVAETYPDLIVKDDEGNCWKNNKVYEFVLNECLTFDENECLLNGYGAAEPFAEKLKEHALTYGVKPILVVKSIDDKIAEANTLMRKENSDKVSEKIIGDQIR